MNYVKHKQTLWLISSVILATLLFTGAASAGEFVIDTTGITGTVNEKVTIPVFVENAENMCGFQLTLTGDTEIADISFNTTQNSAGFVSDDDTGVLLWTGYSPFTTISGTKQVFQIDVTPKKSGDIVLSLDVSVTQTGKDLMTAKDEATPYRGGSSVLSVSGSSQNPVNPPVNPDNPMINPSVTPNTPTETPQETPDVSTETPSGNTPEIPLIPEDTVPTIPDTPDIPVNPPSSPMPLAGILIGLATAVILGRKAI